MKLKDLAVKEETIKIEDDGQEFEILLRSMNQQARSERDEHYEPCRQKALNKARTGSRLDEIKDATDEQLRDMIFSLEMGYYENEEDLLDIENEEALSDEQKTKARKKERKNIERKKKTEIDKMGREDLLIRSKIYIIRTSFFEAFDTAMIQPNLCAVCYDPVTKEKLLSMDPDSEDYIGDIQPEVIDRIFEAAAEFLVPARQEDIRRMTESPDFLSLTLLAGNVA